MIRESGEITSSEGGIAQMRPESRAGCARCAAGEGCGAGLNAWLLADRLDLIECRYQGGEPQVGETVTVEIAETRLLGAAALAYGLPIIGMIVGAVIASFLIAVPSVDAELTVTLAGEAVAVGGALVGLLLGGWLAHAIAHRRRIADLLTPELVRGDRS